MATGRIRKPRAESMMKRLPAPLTICFYGDKTRIAVVMGNCLHENGTVWCHDLETGSRVDLSLDFLHEDPAQLEPGVLVSIIEGWADYGNADAAWWLGCFYEGRNRPKSVWYYIAAIRMCPVGYGWALTRIYADACFPSLAAGVLSSELSFLREIQEFCGAGKFGKWKDAIAKAKEARHTAAGDTQPQKAE